MADGVAQQFKHKAQRHRLPGKGRVEVEDFKVRPIGRHHFFQHRLFGLVALKAFPGAGNLSVELLLEEGGGKELGLAGGDIGVGAPELREGLVRVLLQGFLKKSKQGEDRGRNILISHFAKVINLWF